MDRRDRELLDRQMRRLRPTPPAHGLNALVLVGLFLAGMTAGAFLFAGAGQPVQQKTALAFFYGSGNPTR
jgi:hypothetical protein